MQGFFKNGKEELEFNERMFDSGNEQCWSFGLDWKRRQKIRQIIEEIKPCKSDKILDLGCGAGVYSIQIQDQTKAKVTGFDISKNALRLAKQNGLRHCVQGFAENLPFKKESFDKAFSIETFEHLPDPESAIKELGKVMKKGGLVTISNPIIPDIRLPGYKIEDPKIHGHINFKTIKEYKTLFKKHGFTMVRARRYGIMQWIVGLHNSLASKASGKKEKNKNSKVEKRQTQNSKQSFIKKALEKYYSTLYWIDLKLLYWLPMQDSAFLTFRKN